MVKEVDMRKELLKILRILNPMDIVIDKDKVRGVLILKTKQGKVYDDIVVKRPFPYSRPFFIILYTRDGKEIGVIKDYRALDPRSFKILDEELERIYFIPRILRIKSIVPKTYGVFEWHVRTDKGDIVFVTKGKSIRFLGDKVIIKDEDGIAYLIEDLKKLDRRSIDLLFTVV